MNGSGFSPASDGAPRTHGSATGAPRRSRTRASYGARLRELSGAKTKRQREGFSPDGDEDINTLAIIIPSVEILGPITRSRAHQLNHQINSFICSSAYNTESQLLPNDLIALRNQGDVQGGETEHQKGAGELRRCAREGGEPIQFGIVEFESNSEFRTTSYSN
jgi:hypothetical protein